jgi:hypothetical protein
VCYLLDFISDVFCGSIVTLACPVKDILGHSLDSVAIVLTRLPCAVSCCAARVDGMGL